MTPETRSHHLTGYDAALSGAVIYRVPDAGCLRIGGAGRVDYIQRQTTNDVRLLAADRALATVLTSGTARILDVWRLIDVPGADAIDAITLPGRGAATARYLQKRIFFMDKVTVQDTSAAAAQIALVGPAVEGILSQIGLARIPGPGEIVTHMHNGDAVRILGAEGLIGIGWLLLGSAAALDALAAQIAAAGAAETDAAAFDMLRLEAGLPAPTHELTDEYTPLEANLDAAINAAKGCYAGQEVIARQITYDKVARRLVGLRLEAPAAPGASVQVEGRTAGAITSAAVSPRFGPIALAVLRRPHFAPGVAVTVASPSGLIAGQTVALPFSG